MDNKETKSKGNQRRKREFADTSPKNTPAEQTKFITLGVLASVVILLIWVLTLPLNLKPNQDTVAGPSAIISVIGGGVSGGLDVADQYRSETEQ